MLNNKSVCRLVGLLHYGNDRFLGLSNYGVCRRITGLVFSWVCRIMGRSFIGFVALQGLSPIIGSVAYGVVAYYGL